MLTTADKADAQQTAADVARDRCLADGRADLFVDRYRAECFDRRVNPDERVPVARSRAAIAAELVREPERATIGAPHEIAAAERARDRIVSDPKLTPDQFARLYRDELAR